MPSLGEENTISDLGMRLAREDDKDTLLSWRNDPHVVQFTRTQRAVTLEEHSHWFEKRLEKLEREPIWIFTSGLVHLGMTRLDRIDPRQNGYQVSIVVDNYYQNAGLGKKMLFRTCECAFEQLAAGFIRAEIHNQNSASIKLFTKLGFSKNSTNDDNYSSYDLMPTSLIPLKY